MDEFGEEGDVYKKKLGMMKRMTLLDEKQQNGEEFTNEDLRFLYEIDGGIAGFGYEKDPRIEEFKQNRNIKNDLLAIFDNMYDVPKKLELSKKVSNIRGLGNFNKWISGDDIDEIESIDNDGVYENKRDIIGIIFRRGNTEEIKVILDNMHEFDISVKYIVENFDSIVGYRTRHLFIDSLVENIRNSDIAPKKVLEFLANEGYKKQVLENLILLPEDQRTEIAIKLAGLKMFWEKIDEIKGIDYDKLAEGVYLPTIFDNLDKLKGVNQEKIILRVLERGNFYELNSLWINYEKLDEVSNINRERLLDLSLKLRHSSHGDTITWDEYNMLKNIIENGGFDSTYLATKLIDRGEILELLKVLKYLGKLDFDNSYIPSLLIEKGQMYSLVSSMDNFEELDSEINQKILDSLNEDIDEKSPAVSWYLKNLDKIRGVDYQKVLDSLFEIKELNSRSGTIETLGDNIHQFESVGYKNVILRIIKNDSYWIGVTSSKLFNCIGEIPENDKQEIFETIFSLKGLERKTYFMKGLVYNLSKFENYLDKNIFNVMFSVLSNYARARSLLHQFNKFGFGSMEEAIEYILDEKDADFIQGILNHFNSFENERVDIIKKIIKKGIFENLDFLSEFRLTEEEKSEVNNFIKKVGSNYNKNER